MFVNIWIMHENRMDCIPIILVQTAARGDRVSSDVEVLNFQVFFQLKPIQIRRFFLNFSEQISLGAMGDSFYEYLLKVWIQSNKTDSVARRMYDDAMAAIVNNLIQTSRSGLIYTSDMRYNSLDHTMDHLACFSGKLSFTMNFCIFLTFLNFCIFLTCFDQEAYLHWAQPLRTLQTLRDTWKLEKVSLTLVMNRTSELQRIWGLKSLGSYPFMNSKHSQII